MSDWRNKNQDAIRLGLIIEDKFCKRGFSFIMNRERGAMTDTDENRKSRIKTGVNRR